MPEEKKSQENTKPAPASPAPGFTKTGAPIDPRFPPQEPEVMQTQPVENKKSADKNSEKEERAEGSSKRGGR